MSSLTTYRFVLNRIFADWKLLLSIFVGIMIAAILLAGTPVYINTLERQGIDSAIDRADQTFLNVYILAPYVALNREGLTSTDAVVEKAIGNELTETYRGRERYLKTPTFLAGTPRTPMGDAGTGSRRVSRGYFHQISNLKDHVTWLSGRMASNVIDINTAGPRLEAVISEPSSRAFGLHIGDEVVFTPSISDPIRITVEIVGVLEASDPTEEFWQGNSNILLQPQPLTDQPDIGVEVDPDEPPLPLFISYEAIIEGVGKAYPGSFVNSTWFIYIDKQGLKLWSKDVTRDRINQLEESVADSMSGTAVLTGINKLINDFEKRSFFTSVPLLLLLVVMAITAVYYVAMMVSYLVNSRAADVALLRGRGVTIWQMARIYGLEGFILVVIAVVIAPFVAMIFIALSGKFGYFHEITSGALLPVELHWLPFVAAGCVGLLSLAIYVLPAVLGTRSELVSYKNRSSRPPSIPVFQRYYLDVGLLVIGGLIFWELYSKGQLVSGGLFSDVQVNETLLFAPVLLLTAIALLFTRFFPLLVRYVSGESQAILHLVAAGALSALAIKVVIQELRIGISGEALLEISLIGMIALFYYLSNRTEHKWNELIGLTGQISLIALYAYNYELPISGEASQIPSLGVVILVPAQILFIIFRKMNRFYPIWAAMAIWHMSRNPLQYSWLVLLMVMVTGLGVLATTVGGTLDRSYEERIRYEVGSDLRVTGAPTFFSSGNQSAKAKYMEIPGVTSVSLALRGGGVVGTTHTGNNFRLLSVETEEFPYIAWYRDDFSEQPLTGVMRALQSGIRADAISIPKGAKVLKVWANPQDYYPNMFLWIVVKDNRGILDTLTLGPMSRPGWSLMKTDVPQNLDWPLTLVSVQIYEPVFGPTGTSGTIYLDDIQTEKDNGTGVLILDDFEGDNRWIPLATSIISSDSINVTRETQFNGRQSGAFSFGKDTDQGIRGVYISPTGGAVPVVSSKSFIDAVGIGVGDSIIVNIMGRFVPIKIIDTVHFFPTMDPARNGFILADLNNLLGHLNLLSPISSIRPNEVFISEIPGTEEEVRQIALSLAPSRQMVHDRATLMNNVRLDPLITAGWKLMVLLAVGMIMVVAPLGYVTYLISFSGQSRNEMGLLRALGLTRTQMGWLLSAEHLVIAFVGIVIGTITGFTMSRIMVSAVAVTETGTPVLPPFILTTNWAIMGPVYGALISIFIAALIWLNWMVSKVSLHEVTRIE